jgi:hypothetical protein
MPSGGTCHTRMVVTKFAILPFGELSLVANRSWHRNHLAGYGYAMPCG